MNVVLIRPDLIWPFKSANYYGHVLARSIPLGFYDYWDNAAYAIMTIRRLIRSR